MIVYLKNFKFPTIWTTLGLFQVFITFYLCLRESSGAPPLFEHIDKVFHFTTYFWLSFYFSSIFEKRIHLPQTILLISMGVLIEFLQKLTETRSFDIYDMLANTLGVFLALLLTRVVSLEKLLKSIERQFS